MEKERLYQQLVCRYIDAGSATANVRPSCERMLVCCPAVRELKNIDRHSLHNELHSLELELTAEEGAPRGTIGQVMQVKREEVVMAQNEMGVSESRGCCLAMGS